MQKVTIAILRQGCTLRPMTTRIAQTYRRAEGTGNRSMSTYRTITGYYGYRYGIYDRGAAVIQVRRDGQRFRIRWDAVRWTSHSTGGHHTYTDYLSRAQGRAMVRRVRKAQVRAQQHEWQDKYGCCEMDVLDIISGRA